MSVQRSLAAVCELASLRWQLWSICLEHQGREEQFPSTLPCVTQPRAVVRSFMGAPYVPVMAKSRIEDSPCPVIPPCSTSPRTGIPAL